MRGRLLILSIYIDIICKFGVMAQSKLYLVYVYSV